MTELDKIREVSLRISSQAKQEFPVYTNLLETGISLLIKATSIMEKENPFDKLTHAGALKAAAWRYASTLPMTIFACYEQALLGNYPIAKYILRLVLEEVVSLKFYVEFPAEALKQISSDRGSDAVAFGEKIKRVNLGPNSSWFGKTHGGLSNTYSHANLVIQPELVGKEGEKTILSGGPKYHADDFSSISKFLLVFATDMVTELIGVFETLQNNQSFLLEFIQYRDSVISELFETWPLEAVD